MTPNSSIPLMMGSKSLPLAIFGTAGSDTADAFGGPAVDHGVAAEVEELMNEAAKAGAHTFGSVGLGMIFALTSGRMKSPRVGAVEAARISGGGVLKGGVFPEEVGGAEVALDSASEVVTF